MSRLDRLFDWFRIHDTVSYYSGAGDVNRDGVQDRADTTDGNGVDCSGAVWASYAYAWQPDAAPFPLSSTSGYAWMAEHQHLWVPLNQVKPGDILLHSGNLDVFNSDGPVGHTELFGGVVGTKWRCWGSAGSGHGVGYVDRYPGFWQRALRIPGLEDHSAPVFTREQLDALIAFLKEIDVEHGLLADAKTDGAGRAVNLDRYGGVQIEGKPVVHASKYKPGQDLFRTLVITDRAQPIAGYAVDLNGVWWPWCEDGAPMPPAKNPVTLPAGKIVDFPIGT